MQHPVARIVCNKFHIARLRYSYEHCISRTPRGLRLSSSFTTGNYKLVSMKVDRVVVHPEIDERIGLCLEHMMLARHVETLLIVPVRCRSLAVRDESSRYSWACVGTKRDLRSVAPARDAPPRSLTSMGGISTPTAVPTSGPTKRR